MLSISRHGNGFRVKISEPGTGWRGFSVQARDRKEVHECVDHYYSHRNARQHCGNQRKKVCPFCRKAA
jgi:hypothetical protein